MAPRRILAGLTWFITRRTTRRHFLLRPDADGISQAIYWYTTAVLAKKFGIVIHAVQILSTHIHEVLTDPLGNLPNFVRERNRALANALKCHRGWPEEVFQRAPASYVALHGPEAILKQIGYTLANCVEAGLVTSPEHWPGVTVLPNEIGSRVVEVSRPTMYFNPENEVWPDRASLAIEVPHELKVAYGERAGDKIRVAVDCAVLRAREIARAAGRTVGPIARLLSTPFQRRARSCEPFGTRNPRFATGGDSELAREAKSSWREFLGKYRKALHEWRTGVPRPDFPPGTWRWCRELLASNPANISMSVGSG